MNDSSNSTVQAVCFLPTSSYFTVADEDSVLTLWNNESETGGIAHSQHGSLQRFPLECELVVSISKTLVALHVNLKWTCAFAQYVTFFRCR